MTPDTPPASITNVAHEGERLRMALLDEMRRAPSTAHRAAVVTELMMFYGQAFAAVQLALPEPFSTDALTVKILHESVCGMAIYNVRLTWETPLNPWEDYERMTGHWQKVTAMVLGEDE